MNLIVLGLILNFTGTFILIFVTLFGKWHQIKYDNPWTKKYWWMGRRPFWKDTKTKKWRFKWGHVEIVEGFIPPKHLWNSIGFSLISGGFLFQIINIIKT